MPKFAIYCWLALGVWMMPKSTMAGDDSQEMEHPPLQYPLSQVGISVLHQTSRDLPGGYRIEIGGDGKAFNWQTSAENAQPVELQVSKETLLNLLNEFYRLHFFELFDSYGVKKKVVLRDETVVTTAMKLADISSKRLCIRLADYQKCVTIVDEQPVAAVELIKQIEGLFVKS